MSDGPAVYHSFARSGGTIVNRLLGASRGVLVLSEVGPRASVRDPVDQAIEWLGLAEATEAGSLRELTFGELVVELDRRAAARHEHLVLRDFVTPNFLVRAHGQLLPSSTVELLVALGDEPRRAVVTRRSAAVFASIVRSFPHLASLDIDEFAVAYDAYAAAVADVPIVRYEDLSADPAGGLEALTGYLGCPYDPDALTAFTRFRACTGDVMLRTPSRGDALDRVLPLEDRADDPAFVAAAEHPLCRVADERFGYPPIGEDAPTARAVDSLRAALGSARRTALDLDATRAHHETELLRLDGELRALHAEVAQLRRARDEAHGELARAEAINADRQRQIGLLLEESHRP